MIGKQCRDVDEADAADVIAGYTCGVDLSNRDDQSREQNWVRGKAFDGSAPLGPVLATPEVVPDNARIRLWQNGELRQDATLDQLIFPPAELIAEITSYVTLESGDVILTGTPEGVARSPTATRSRWKSRALAGWSMAWKFPESPLQCPRRTVSDANGDGSTHPNTLVPLPRCGN